MSEIHRARLVVANLHERLGWLRLNIINGTARPYRAPTLTPDQRALADARARAERLERIDIAPGDSPDPYNFEAADLCGQIAATAAVLAAEIAQPAADDVLRKAARAAEDLVLRADTLLGHITDGQTLQAVCPFCQGRSDAKPAGGDYTLRIMRGRQGTQLAGRTLIVCFGQCAPDDTACGYRWGGHPAWDLHDEGEWFADRITQIESVQRYNCAWCGVQFERPAGKRGRPTVYCCDEHRRAANAHRKAVSRRAA